MQINKSGKLEAKKRLQETETVVTVREECEVCDGTGLLYQDERALDCFECQGHGMVQVSRKKEINRERK